jgi:hypothetical protein
MQKIENQPYGAGWELVCIWQLCFGSSKIGCCFRLAHVFLHEVAVKAKLYYLDQDGDGYGVITDGYNPDGYYNIIACGAPDGYVAISGDCNDNDANILPNAPEFCDGKDNDCDGQVDEGAGIKYYKDVDRDGYGNIISKNWHFFHCRALLNNFLYKR